ncbi:hypothetical protein [Synechococcus sp. O70.2]|uniref:hypothetical protein n=1 Tax=Synechococcus sp. O70.2 TaxID=2964533 RepID=UPI0039C3CA11
MSIRLIVESVLQSACLTREQESQICYLLQERFYDELDLEALDRLTLALLEGQSPPGERGKKPRRLARSSRSPIVWRPAWPTLPRDALPPPLAACLPEAFLPI